MTELPPDDEFTDFFNEEAKRAREAAEAAELRDLIGNEILQVFNAYDVPHLWHPDEAQQTANLQSAVIALEAENFAMGATEDMLPPKHQVFMDFADESGMITHIIMLKIVKMHGWPDTTEEGREKKKLLAELQIKGYDARWQTAVDHLLTGEALDITREEDLQIYVKTAQHFISPEDDQINHLVRSIEAILLEGKEDKSLEMQDRIVAAAPSTASHLIRAASRPDRMADAEAYLYGLAREEIITPDQLQSLLALL